MPRSADAQARRRQIVDAALRLAGRDGLHTVSMRGVAAEAGTSLRLVQYYFGTKENLLLCVLQHLADRIRARAAATLPANDVAARPREVIAAILAEALPTDADSRIFHLVYTAYAVLAMTDPVLAAQPFMSGPNDMIKLFTEQLHRAQTAGAMALHFDAETEAVSLLAMSAGLGTSVLLGQCTGDQARAVLTYHLDRLVPHRP